MIKQTLRLFVLVISMFLASASTTSAQTVDSAEALQLSVRRLNSWLGSGPKAEGWRKALWLAALEGQSALGYGADPVLLNQILQQFNAGYAGSDHPSFQDVRNALTVHTHLLYSAGSSDLKASVFQARSSYRPLNESDVLQSRNEVLANLRLMDRRYMAGKSSEERAELYTKIGFHELVSQLEGLQIAPLLPPDGSAMNSQDVLPSEDVATEEELAKRSAEEKLRQEILQTDQPQQERDRNAERTRLLRSLLTSVRNFEDAAIDNPDVWMLSSVVTLDRFVRLVAAATSTQTETEFNEALDTIEKNLELLSDPRQRRAIIETGEALGKLAHSRQAPGLIAAVRRSHAQPNASLVVSGNMLSEAVNRFETDTLPVDENILGRQINGTAFTQTNVSLDLMDDPYQVSASILLRGTINSDTFTKTGPITAFAGSNGMFEGRRNLYANIGGFYINDPYVAANVSSFFKGVDCRLRLVQKIATKQYSKDKFQSEGIAAGRAENRIEQTFTSKTDEALGTAREQFSDAQPQMFDVARWIPEIALKSTSQSIRGLAVKTDPVRLGASDAAPGNRVPSDIRICLHQSIIANYVDPLLSGRRFTNEELGKLAEQMTGEVPEAFNQKDETESWSITFPPTGAIAVDLNDSIMAVEITGRRFSQEDRQINAPLVIRMEFQLVHQGGKILLRQVGKPTITYVDEADMNARVVAFKSFLESKLEAGYDGKASGFEMPENLIPAEKIEQVKIRDLASKLSLVEMRIENGWLMAGWKKLAGNYDVISTDKPALTISTEPLVPDTTPPVDFDIEMPPEKAGDKVAPPVPAEDK